MDRRALVLAALSVAGGGKHTPVQVQKLLFLIDRNAASLIGGKQFNFRPYHYGPFDPAVYWTLDELASDGLVDKLPDHSWTSYSLTPDGQGEGARVLATLNPKAAEYVKRASEFVRRLSFNSLVASMYKAYPDMSKNSVFRRSES